jgi:branched-chain amino acid transport system substrate-binding protein
MASPLPDHIRLFGPQWRRAVAAGAALAVSLSVVGCGSRVPLSKLLAYSRNGTPGQAGAAAGGASDQGSASGLASGSTDGSSGSTSAASGGSSAGHASGSTGGNSGSGGGSSGVSGSNNGSSASGGIQTGGGAGQAAGCSSPRSTINIGSVGELSGVFAPFLQPVVQGVAAFVAAVNATGGLNCHPLKYIQLDDGGDPSVNQSDTQRLVEQNHVIALVGAVAPLAGNASVAYITQHQIPVIGSEGGSPWFYQSPMYFPQITTNDPALGGFVSAGAAIGKPQGKTKLATITCIEVPSCSDLYGIAPSLAQRYGLTLVYRGQGSLTQPDFTSNCQAAQQAGAQLFALGMDTNSIERLLKACESIGYHPLYFTGGPLATPALAADSRAEGLIDVSFNIPFIQTNNPAVAAMQAAIKRFAPGVQPSTGTMAGWVAGTLLQTAAAHLSEPPTSQSLLQGLWSIKNNDLGGITGPLTFTQGQNAPPQVCFWTMQIHAGGFAPIGSPNRVCG